MDDQKNMIMAAVLSFLVIVLWTFYFAPPPPEPGMEQTAVQTTDNGAAVGGGVGAGQSNIAAGGQTGDAGGTDEVGFVEIDTPSLSGSFSLKGGRIDNIQLLNYRETLDENSDTVTQLAPVGTTHPYFAAYGWLAGEGTVAKTPDPNTIWSVESGDTLSAGAPVTLRWDNGEGLIFRRTMSVDDRYMFNITQSLENTTGQAVQMSPYGYIARRNQPDTINFFILHEGAVGVFDGELKEMDYDDMADLPLIGNQQSEQIPVQQNGFIGFTDKYWMTAIAPGPNTAFTGVYKYTQRATGPEYRTEALMPVYDVPAGGAVDVQTYLFSGAKAYDAITGYEADLGIAGFIDSIDWGWFFFLTKPIFQLLIWVKGFIGNMGWSIIVLTLIIKAALFPLAYKSYVSMSKMKKLQPEMEKIKERVGDDKQKMQQEMMALYKKEKANPAAGCLPILVQIPIFFSLYKVLFVTIEMRHAPFIGWITDLSAPDPTSWMNLFGALPYDVPEPGVGILGLFSIGVFPILMGVTMWMQQKLNPSPTDKMQAQIFAIMPWMFMFMLGTFASGLVIYWCANNIITFTQQYTIMRSQGVKVDFLGNVAKTFKKKPKEG